MNETEIEQIQRLHLRYPHSHAFNDWRKGSVPLDERQLELKLENRIETLKSLIASDTSSSTNKFDSWTSNVASSFNLHRFQSDREYTIRALAQVPFSGPPAFDSQIYEKIVCFLKFLLIIFLFFKTFNYFN